VRDGVDHTGIVGEARHGAVSGRVTPSMLIRDVLLEYPSTRAVFAAWCLPCPRCLASEYETVGQLAVTISLDGIAVVADLNRAIKADFPDAWRWPHAGPTSRN
jgi:hypothetical protein